MAKKSRAPPTIEPTMALLSCQDSSPSASWFEIAEVSVSFSIALESSVAVSELVLVELSVSSYRLAEPGNEFNVPNSMRHEQRLRATKMGLG